ncbi:MAG: hypothetical protein ACKVX7_11730 [Planctomycetota bacterium]
MIKRSSKKKKLLIVLGVLLVLGGVLGFIAWYKFFREEPQRAFKDEADRFKYGSIGAENDRGLPYWIWLVLPRAFPDLLPGSGGWKSFGLVWEEGQEVPAGFSKKVIGFPRIANNCAICHTGTWRAKDDEVPNVVAAAPSHTTDVQGIIRFLTAAAKDPRFNADTLMPLIERETELSFLDQVLYRFVIIPFTRKTLLEQEEQFDWMNRPGMPHWGKGRDDPMNLTKYFMTNMPVDNSTGQADFPSVWNLGVRKGTPEVPRYLNWSCDTPAVRSVLIDSALGLGARAGAPFLKRMEELDNFLSALPPPKWPFTGEHAIKPALATAGKAIYDRDCASCHEPGREFTNKPIPIAEIQTDRERLDTWTQEAADKANRAVKDLGITRPDMVKNDGYCSPPLDGLWLRAPYLHNGAVPTLRELLEPVEKRTKRFYRGYDVYDPINVGFVTQGPEAERVGWLLDTAVRGDSNVGHLYGTTLSTSDKEALLEYLKSL